MTSGISSSEILVATVGQIIPIKFSTSLQDISRALKTVKEQTAGRISASRVITARLVSLSVWWIAE